MRKGIQVLPEQLIVFMISGAILPQKFQFFIVGPGARTFKGDRQVITGCSTIIQGLQLALILFGVLQNGVFVVVGTAHLAAGVNLLQMVLLEDCAIVNIIIFYNCDHLDFFEVLVVKD